MEAFGAPRCPRDAKMDLKDGPQASKMRPKIDENLVWGPYNGQEESPGSNLRFPGLPLRRVSGQNWIKNIEKNDIV